MSMQLNPDPALAEDEWMSQHPHAERAAEEVVRVGRIGPEVISMAAGAATIGAVIDGAVAALVGAVIGAILGVIMWIFGRRPRRRSTSAAG